MSRSAAWKEFASAIGLWELKGYGAWSIEDRESGAYLGETGIFHPTHFPEAELGWTLMEHAEGRGIAFEAATEVRAYAYSEAGLRTLVSYIAPENQRSIRLAERLGARIDHDARRPANDPCLVYRHPGPEEAE